MAGDDSVYSGSIAGQVIDRALKRGRLAHALLLHAPTIDTLEGFARQLASRLLKLAPGWPSGKAGHPDLVTLRPSGKSRQIRIGDDATEANTMRSFIRQLAQSPAAGDRKVGVVFEAERMNANSANAFLKTLEEPPLDTTLLLLTTRPYSLLTTIRSRCLNFRIPADGVTATDPELAGWLGDYRGWLRSLASGAATDKGAASRQVMTVYALVARFAQWLEKSTARALEQLRSTGALENLDDDEIDALKTSTANGVRQRFFADLETATCALAREVEAGRSAAPATVTELERAAGLLRVNLNENSALELLLLSALRAWSRRE